MPVQWYYQNQAGVVGPVSVAELQYLIDAGTISGSTLARRGQDGPWLAADKIRGPLRAAVDDAGADDSASEVLEWHFNLKGQNRNKAPCRGTALRAMVAEEKLQISDDLVWKPGMAMWVQSVKSSRAHESRWLIRRFKKRVCGTKLQLHRTRSDALWAGVTATVLLGLIAAAGWKWARTESTDPRDTRVARARALTDTGARLKTGLGPVEQLLEDARSAVRVDQLDRATRLLEQYLASPSAGEGDAAKGLLNAIKLARSVPEAVRLAQDLSDEALKDYLRNGVDTLLAAIETPELRPTYERTILQALRQENNRRQMIPRVAIARSPNPVEEAPIAKDQEPRSSHACTYGKARPRGTTPAASIFGPAGLAGRGAGVNPDAKDDVNLAMAGRRSEKVQRIGRDLFERVWVKNDPRGHGGDGLGPVFNAQSCVGCHNLAGSGGAGNVGANVQIVTVTGASSDGGGNDLSFSTDFGAGLFGHGRRGSSGGSALRRSHAESTFLPGIHPGFRDANSIVLHRYGIDPAYNAWRGSVLGQHGPILIKKARGKYTGIVRSGPDRRHS